MCASVVAGAFATPAPAAYAVPERWLFDAICALIRGNLANRTLTPTHLCRRFNCSRSQPLPDVSSRGRHGSPHPPRISRTLSRGAHELTSGSQARLRRRPALGSRQPKPLLSPVPSHVRYDAGGSIEPRPACRSRSRFRRPPVPAGTRRPFIIGSAAFTAREALLTCGCRPKAPEQVPLTCWPILGPLDS